MIHNIAAVRAFGRWRRITGCTLACVVLVSLGGGDIRPDNLTFQLDSIVAEKRFDFLTWTLPAIAREAAQTVSSPQDYLSSDERSAVVKEFFELLGSAIDLQTIINNAYSDPNISDPIQVTEQTAVHLSDTRDELAVTVSLAEDILQEQIASVLIREGFGVLGRIVPPVTFQITELPDLIVVSPRDRIELLMTAHLAPGLAVHEHVELESRVDDQLDEVSLVLPIAGLSSFPAMVQETTDLLDVFEIAAHEWVHLYLATRPLGLQYDSSPELRTMNETTANIVGKAIGFVVIKHYYPDLSQQLDLRNPNSSLGSNSAAMFDFHGEMRETRVHVEELLASGSIAKAETYMEKRRWVFVNNGYRIRKLNQAYFAFHGAYADKPGAAGKDMVGPTVMEFWQLSYTVKEFLEEMSRVTSLFQLQSMVASRPH